LVKKWYPLDNAAKVFPAVMTRRTSTLFRLEAVLDSPVRTLLLQQALENILPRFPYFQVELRRGFFWYYLQFIDLVPRVEPEQGYPCRYIPIRRGGCHLFRTIAAENRVAVEFSHILTDGTGALVFLKALLGEYFRLSGEDVSQMEGVFTREETPDPQEGEDAYKRYMDNSIPSPEKLSRAFHIPYPLAAKPVYHTVHGFLSAGAVAARAGEYGVTVTEFLAALFIQTLQTVRQSMKNPGRNRVSSTIRLEIPVNLRRLYPSRTVRNFTLFVTPGIDLRLGPWSFPEILKVVHHYMKVEVDARFINRQIARNVRGESHPLVRITPLGLKNFLLSLAYKKFGDSLYSGFLTNLGRITLPPELERHVRQIRFIPPRNPITKSNCGITGYGDRLTISFGRHVRESEVERIFFTGLREQGIPVTIQSGGTETMQCPDCQVEVVPGEQRCPLCGRSLGKQEGTVPPEKAESGEDPISRLEPGQKRRLGWELAILLLGSAFLIVLAIDFYTARSFTWSRYAGSALAAGAAVLSVIYFLHARFVLAGTLVFLTVSGWLFLLDLFRGGVTWFFSLALPLLALLAGTSALTAGLLRRLKSRGLNVPGFILIILALFCMGLDLLLNRTLSGTPEITWSAIVAIALFPVTVFMLFIHYRMRKGSDFRRFFHL